MALGGEGVGVGVQVGALAFSAAFVLGFTMKGRRGRNEGEDGDTSSRPVGGKWRATTDWKRGGDS